MGPVIYQSTMKSAMKQGLTASVNIKPISIFRICQPSFFKQFP